WEDPKFDTSGWVGVQPLGVAEAKATNRVGLAIAWQLVPRTIPLPEQRPVRFAEIRRATGIKADAAILRGTGDLVVPANSRVTLLVDNREMTMGYPVLRTSGGAGATATLTYAESLFDPQDRKGNRNDVAGKTIRGVRDRFRFDGGADRRFQPLWLRAFRYVEVDFTTGAEPLRIRDFHSIFAAYPMEQRASFASDAAWLGDIWQLDWRALRLSAFETYWVTPYYEQLQYVGDSRIEALLTLYQSGDDRLMRNALMQFDQSRIAEGITRSSYPSSTPQLIPPFSLWWIGMIHDHWMLRDDPAFIRSLLPGTRGVLDWYERHLDANGLLGAMPWWNFVDWSYEPEGVPPGGRTGGSAAITLQFAIALREAADLEVALGRAETAARYRGVADRLVRAVRGLTWDEGRGLFADTPQRTTFSQQTNALAILADALPPEQRRAVMQRVLDDASILPASFYFRFYVDEALRRSGLADRYLDRLGPWREMLRNGLTATAETPEPSRSDSHAWSAHPNYHLLATVLGIQPAAPGFKAIAIEPAMGSLKRAEGSMPHPAGMLRVRLRRSGKDGLRAAIDLPPGVPGTFSWRGQSVPLSAGATQLRCNPRCRAE
ncbi:MAG: alpha-L-rhamnosidase C-terminal domain-containing protein, partial [Rhizorhabdus sp.]